MTQKRRNRRSRSSVAFFRPLSPPLAAAAETSSNALMSSLSLTFTSPSEMVRMRSNASGANVMATARTRNCVVLAVAEEVTSAALRVFSGKLGPPNAGPVPGT